MRSTHCKQKGQQSGAGHSSALSGAVQGMSDIMYWRDPPFYILCRTIPDSHKWSVIPEDRKNQDNSFLNHICSLFFFHKELFTLCTHACFSLAVFQMRVKDPVKGMVALEDWGCSVFLDAAVHEGNSRALAPPNVIHLKQHVRTWKII